MDPDQFLELTDDDEDSEDFVPDATVIEEEESLLYLDFVYSFIATFNEASPLKYRKIFKTFQSSPIFLF